MYNLIVRVFNANDKKWFFLYLPLGWGECVSSTYHITNKTRLLCRILCTVHVYAQTNTHTHVHTHTHTHTHAHAHICTHTRTHAHTHTHTNTYTYTYTHVYMHTYICTHNILIKNYFNELYKCLEEHYNILTLELDSNILYTSNFSSGTPLPIALISVAIRHEQYIIFDKRSGQPVAYVVYEGMHTCVNLLQL